MSQGIITIDFVEINDNIMVHLPMDIIKRNFQNLG